MIVREVVVGIYHLSDLIQLAVERSVQLVDVRYELGLPVQLFDYACVGDVELAVHEDAERGLVLQEVNVFESVLGEEVLVLIQVLLVVCELHERNIEVLEELTSENVVNHEVEKCARMEKRERGQGPLRRLAKNQAEVVYQVMIQVLVVMYFLFL